LSDKRQNGESDGAEREAEALRGRLASSGCDEREPRERADRGEEEKGKFASCSGRRGTVPRAAKPRKDVARLNQRSENIYKFEMRNGRNAPRHTPKI